MAEVIRSTDPGVIERCRATGTAWAELAPGDRQVYERIQNRLAEIATSAEAIAKSHGNFVHRLKAGFTLKSGVRGSQPKDLWLAICHSEAPLGMPQLYMIVSARGVEYGFAPAIHPSDFSDQKSKNKLAALIPDLLATIPSASSQTATELGKQLEITGGWYFRRKARQDPFGTDFKTLQEFLEFVRSPAGIRWGAGAICRYVRPEQLADPNLDLKKDFESIISIFTPLLNEMLLTNNKKLTIEDLLDASADELNSVDIIHNALETFMGTYSDIRSNKPYKRDPGLWDLMQRLTAALGGTSAVQKRPNIKVKWSVGKGNWVGVPHVSFLDQRETTTTERGLYGVFLFREDLSGVYLTLNQGVTEFVNKNVRSEARRILRERADKFGAMVLELKAGGFSVDAKIDLKTEGDLGQDYEASTIAYKLYPRGAVPSDAAISADVELLLEAQDKLFLSKEPSRKTWIFQANPERFDIDGALSELDELSWLVNQHGADIHEGDEVFVWRSGSQGGIVAAGTILTEPDEFESLPEEHKFNRDADKFEGPRTRVRIGIDEIVSPVLLRTEIADAPTLSDLQILRMAQVTNSPVNIAQAKTIRNLIRDRRQSQVSPISQNQRVWLIAAGRTAEHWEEFYRNGIVAIGWNGLGDLRQYKSKEEIAAQLQSSGAETSASNDAASCYDFAYTVQEGDLVLVKKGRHVIVGYGVVTGPYIYDGSRSGYRNFRTVRWQGRGDWSTDYTLAMKTVTNITLRAELVEHLKQLIGTTNERINIEPLSAGERRAYSIDDAMDGLFINKEEFQDIVRTWRGKKNLILQGPPGVGKTFIAQKLAFVLMGYEDESRVRRIQFHQSYSYEDFIQGYRPTENGFERKNGVFYEFYNQAILDDSNNYVFIIDEINRGNLSKIFGELMVLIESDKRDPKWAVPLTYARNANEQFYIPANVYLLGMMNTADRSLSMVDYALRRRFAFHNLKSKITASSYKEYLTAHGVPDNIATAIIERIETLNQFISNKTDSNLGSDFCIGHSFFMPSNDSESWDLNWYRRVVETELVPLLSEYWFDDDDRVEEWRAKLLAEI